MLEWATRIAFFTFGMSLGIFFAMWWDGKYIAKIEKELWSLKQDKQEKKGIWYE